MNSHHEAPAAVEAMRPRRRATTALLATLMLLMGLVGVVATSGPAGAMTTDSGTQGQINKTGDGDGAAGSVGWCNGFLGTGLPVDYRYHLDGWNTVWQMSKDGGATWADAPNGSTFANGDQVRVTFNATSGTALGNEIFSQTHAGGSTSALTSTLSVQNASVSPLTTATGVAGVPNPGGAVRYVNDFSVTAGPFTMSAGSPNTAVFDVTNLKIDSSNKPDCNAGFDVAAKDLSFTIVREPVNLCLNPPPAGFIDVAPGQYYSLPIDWLVAKGITDGTLPGMFSPTQKVTRGQMAMFLWRYADSPTGAPDNGFNDVSALDYYNDAVSWLVDEGITGGTGPGTFSPKAPVKRKDMAVFIWKAEGSPAPTGANLFTDIPANQYYTDAVTWMAEQGITGGTGPGTFSPNASIIRRDMAVFLYKRSCGALLT